MVVRQPRSALWSTLAVLCWGGLAAFASVSQAATSSVAKTLDDPYVSVRVRAADVVFVGTVRMLEKSECLASGLVLSRQGIVFNVDTVLKGKVSAGTDITVYHTLMGSDPLEVVVEECLQVSPEIVSIGRKFLVACSHNTSRYSRGGWSITGGPWMADSEGERVINTAIAQGSISRVEEFWLLHEVAVARFIQDQRPFPESIRQNIKFFEGLTGLKSSESGKEATSISRATLKHDLELWKKWYECHSDCLKWDDERFKVVVDSERLKEEQPCDSPSE